MAVGRNELNMMINAIDNASANIKNVGGSIGQLTNSVNQSNAAFKQYQATVVSSATAMAQAINRVTQAQQAATAARQAEAAANRADRSRAADQRDRAMDIREESNAIRMVALQQREAAAAAAAANKQKMDSMRQTTQVVTAFNRVANEGVASMYAISAAANNASSAVAAIGAVFSQGIRAVGNAAISFLQMAQNINTAFQLIGNAVGSAVNAFAPPIGTLISFATTAVSLVTGAFLSLAQVTVAVWREIGTAVVAGAQMAMQGVIQLAGLLGQGLLAGFGALFAVVQEVGGSVGGFIAKLTGVSGAFQQATNDGSLFGAMLRDNIVAGAAFAVTLSAIQAAMGALREVGRIAYDAAFSFNALQERALAAFTSMMGGTAEAKASAEAYLNTIKQFARQTPFDVPSLIEAAQKFMGVGIAAENVIPILRNLAGAMAFGGANVKDIDGIVVALTQMARNVKINAQDMSQLSQRGIDAWRILTEYVQANSDKFGDAVSKDFARAQGQVRKMAEQGKLSANDMLNALDHAFQTKNWRELFDNMSQSWEVVTTNLVDQITQISADIFKPLFDAAKQFVFWLQAALGSGAIQQIAANLRSTVDEMVSMLAPIGQRLSKIFDNIGKAFESGGIRAALDVAAQEFYDFASDMFGAGFQVAAEFARGILQGAQQLIDGAARGIAGMIARFLVGQSPPPEGPLSDIDQAGKRLVETYLAGMGMASMESVKGITRQIKNALTGETIEVSVSGFLGEVQAAQTDATKLGAIVERIEDAMRGVRNQQSEINSAIRDANFVIQEVRDAYEDYIQSIQRGIDAINETNAAYYKQVELLDRLKDIELQREKLALQGDPGKLAAIDAEIEALQEREKALSFREKERQLNEQEKAHAEAMLNYQRQLFDYEKSRILTLIRGGKVTAQPPKRPEIKDLEAARERFAIEKAIYNLNRQKDALNNKPAMRELEIRIAIARRQAETNRLAKEEWEIRNQIATLPMEEEIKRARKEMQDLLEPLQDYVRGLQRAKHEIDTFAEGLQRVKQIAQDLVGDIKRAEQAINALNLTPEQAGESAGAKIGESLTKGLKDYWDKHAPGIIGGMVGAQLGGALFGPLGALAGGMFGYAFGEELNTQLGGDIGGVIKSKVGEGLLWLQDQAIKTAQSFRPVGAEATNASRTGQLAFSGLGLILGGLQQLLAGDLKGATETFGTAMRTLGQAIGHGIAALGDFLGLRLDPAGNAWTNLGAVIAEAARQIGLAIDNVLITLEGFLGKDPAKEGETKWGRIVNIWNGIWTGLKTVFGYILQGFDELIGYNPDAGKTRWEAFTKAIEDLWKWVKDTWTELVNFVAWLTDVPIGQSNWETLQNIFRDLKKDGGDALVWLKQKFDEFMQFVKDPATLQNLISIKDSLVGMLGQVARFFGIGGDTTEAFGNNVRGGTEEVLSSQTNLKNILGDVLKLIEELTRQSLNFMDVVNTIGEILIIDVRVLATLFIALGKMIFYVGDALSKLVSRDFAGALESTKKIFSEPFDEIWNSVAASFGVFSKWNDMLKRIQERGAKAAVPAQDTAAQAAAAAESARKIEEARQRAAEAVRSAGVAMPTNPMFGPSPEEVAAAARAAEQGGTKVAEAAAEGTRAVMPEARSAVDDGLALAAKGVEAHAPEFATAGRALGNALVEGVNERVQMIAKGDNALQGVGIAFGGALAGGMITGIKAVDTVAVEVVNTLSGQFGAHTKTFYDVGSTYGSNVTAGFRDLLTGDAGLWGESVVLMNNTLRSEGVLKTFYDTGSSAASYYERGWADQIALLLKQFDESATGIATQIGSETHLNEMRGVGTAYVDAVVAAFTARLDQRSADIDTAVTGVANQIQSPSHLVEMMRAGINLADSFIDGLIAQMDTRLADLRNKMDELKAVMDQSEDAFATSGNTLGAALMKAIIAAIPFGIGPLVEELGKLAAQTARNTTQYANAGENLGLAFLKGLRDALVGNEGFLSQMGVWLIDQLMYGMSGGTRQAEETGRAMGQGAASGAEDQQKQMYAAGADAAYQYHKGFTDEGEIASPSKMTERDGKALIDGLVKGLKASPQIAKNIAIIVEEAMRAGIDPVIALSLAAVESSFNNMAVGDNGRSVGLFQLHEAGAGAGMTREQRQDPRTNARTFFEREKAAFERAAASGLKGADLAVRSGRLAERPIEGAEVKYGKAYIDLIAVLKGVTGEVADLSTVLIALSQDGTLTPAPGSAPAGRSGAPGMPRPVFMPLSLPVVPEIRTRGGQPLAGPESFPVPTGRGLPTPPSSMPGSGSRGGPSMGQWGALSPDNVKALRAELEKLNVKIGEMTTAMDAAVAAGDDLTAEALGAEIGLLGTQAGQLGQILANNARQTKDATQTAMSAAERFTAFMEGKLVPAGLAAGNALQQMGVGLDPLIDRVESGQISTEMLVRQIADVAAKTGLAYQPMQGLASGAMNADQAMRALLDAAALTDPEFTKLRQKMIDMGATTDQIAVAFVNLLSNMSGNSIAAVAQMAENIGAVNVQVKAGTLSGRELTVVLAEMANASALTSEAIVGLEDGTMSWQAAVAKVIDSSKDASPEFFNLWKSLKDGKISIEDAQKKYLELLSTFRATPQAAAAAAEAIQRANDAVAAAPKPGEVRRIDRNAPTIAAPAVTAPSGIRAPVVTPGATAGAPRFDPTALTAPAVAAGNAANAWDREVARLKDSISKSLSEVQAILATSKEKITLPVDEQWIGADIGKLIPKDLPFEVRTNLENLFKQLKRQWEEYARIYRAGPNVIDEMRQLRPGQTGPVATGPYIDDGTGPNGTRSGGRSGAPAMPLPTVTPQQTNAAVAANQQAGAQAAAGLVTGMQSALPMIQQTLTQILTATQSIGSTLAQVGATLGQQLVEGVSIGMAQVSRIVENTAAQLMEHIFTVMRAAAEIRSPSKRGEEIGEDIGEGVAEGVSNSENAIRQRLEGIVKRVTSEFLGMALSAEGLGDIVWANQEQILRLSIRIAQEEQKLLGLRHQIADLEENIARTVAGSVGDQVRLLQIETRRGQIEMLRLQAQRQILQEFGPRLAQMEGRSLELSVQIAQAELQRLPILQAIERLKADIEIAQKGDLATQLRIFDMETARLQNSLAIARAQQDIRKQFTDLLGIEQQLAAQAVKRAEAELRILPSKQRLDRVNAQLERTQKGSLADQITQIRRNEQINKNKLRLLEIEEKIGEAQNRDVLEGASLTEANLARRGLVDYSSTSGEDELDRLESEREQIEEANRALERQTEIEQLNREIRSTGLLITKAMLEDQIDRFEEMNREEEERTQWLEAQKNLREAQKSLLEAMVIGPLQQENELLQGELEILELIGQIRTRDLERELIVREDQLRLIDRGLLGLQQEVALLDAQKKLIEAMKALREFQLAGPFQQELELLENEAAMIKLRNELAAAGMKEQLIYLKEREYQESRTLKQMERQLEVLNAQKKVYDAINALIAGLLERETPDEGGGDKGGKGKKGKGGLGGLGDVGENVTKPIKEAGKAAEEFKIELERLINGNYVLRVDNTIFGLSEQQLNDLRRQLEGLSSDAPATIRINGEDVNLTAEQVGRLKEVLGQLPPGIDLKIDDSTLIRVKDQDIPGLKDQLAQIEEAGGTIFINGTEVTLSREQVAALITQVGAVEQNHGAVLIDVSNVGVAAEAVAGLTLDITAVGDNPGTININGQSVTISQEQLTALRSYLDTLGEQPGTITINGQAVTLSAEQVAGLKATLAGMAEVTTPINVDSTQVGAAGEAIENLPDTHPVFVPVDTTQLDAVPGQVESIPDPHLVIGVDGTALDGAVAAAAETHPLNMATQVDPERLNAAIEEANRDHPLNMTTEVTTTDLQAAIAEAASNHNLNFDDLVNNGDMMAAIRQAAEMHNLNFDDVMNRGDLDRAIQEANQTRTIRFNTNVDQSGVRGWLDSIINRVWPIRFQGNAPGRARGGEVQRPTAYVVGEQGPELFVPYTNGRIIPNSRTMQMLQQNGYTGRQGGGGVRSEWTPAQQSFLDSTAKAFGQNSWIWRFLQDALRRGMVQITEVGVQIADILKGRLGKTITEQLERMTTSQPLEVPAQPVVGPNADPIEMAPIPVQVQPDTSLIAPGIAAATSILTATPQAVPFRAVVDTAALQVAYNEAAAIPHPVFFAARLDVQPLIAAYLEAATIAHPVWFMAQIDVQALIAAYLEAATVPHPVWFMAQIDVQALINAYLEAATIPHPVWFVAQIDVQALINAYLEAANVQHPAQFVARIDVNALINAYLEAATRDHPVRFVAQLHRGSFDHQMADLTKPREVKVYVKQEGGVKPPGRASGGPVMPEMYRVGELGPELFVPWDRGVILPAHMTKQIMDAVPGMATGGMVGLSDWRGIPERDPVDGSIQGVIAGLISSFQMLGVAVSRTAYMIVSSMADANRETMVYADAMRYAARNNAPMSSGRVVDSSYSRNGPAVQNIQHNEVKVNYNYMGDRKISGQTELERVVGDTLRIAGLG